MSRWKRSNTYSFICKRGCAEGHQWSGIFFQEKKKKTNSKCADHVLGNCSGKRCKNLTIIFLQWAYKLKDNSPILGAKIKLVYFSISELDNGVSFLGKNINSNSFFNNSHFSSEFICLYLSFWLFLLPKHGKKKIVPTIKNLLHFFYYQKDDIVNQFWNWVFDILTLCSRISHVKFLTKKTKMKWILGAFLMVLNAVIQGKNLIYCASACTVHIRTVSS